MAGTFQSGNDLLRKCESADPATHYSDDAFCLAYIEGVMDTIGEGLEIRGLPACPAPYTAEAGQLKDIVVQYLKAQPQIRHIPAADSVALAIFKAFPCR
jgi:Rap1a immunity proteins